MRFKSKLNARAAVSTALLLFVSALPGICQAPVPVAAAAPYVSSPAAAAASAPSGTTATSTTGSKADVPVKKPDSVRIAVALPKTQMGSTATGGISGAGEALRHLEMQYLRGPAIEIVALEAMLPSQMAEEAKVKQCDYILYSSLAEKTNNSSSMFRRVMPMASMIPMVGAMGGMTGAVAGTVAAAAATGASGLAGDVKAKSEVTFDYKLVSAGESTAEAKAAETLKAKAKQDGEDIISPLIEKAATDILAHVAKH